MPASRSLRNWRTERAAALDELEAAHAAVGGTGPGRRTATQALNQSYVALLAGHFQGFCRDLHTEWSATLAEAFAANAERAWRSAAGVVCGPPPAPAVERWRGLRRLTYRNLTASRRLDGGNANLETLEDDFGRLLDVKLKTVLPSLDRRADGRLQRLRMLNMWRNAIGHQDFRKPTVTTGRVALKDVRDWRRACDGLAETLDRLCRQLLTDLANPR